MSLLLEALKRAERQRQQQPPLHPAAKTRQEAEPQPPVPFPELAMAPEPMPTPEPCPAEEHPEPALVPDAQPQAEAPSPRLELSLADPSPLETTAPAEPEPAVAAEQVTPVRVETVPLEMAPPPSPEPPWIEPKEPSPVQPTPAAKAAPTPFADADQRERVRALLGSSPSPSKPALGRKRQLVLGGAALAVALGTAGVLFWLEGQTISSTVVQADAHREAPAATLASPSDTERAPGNPEPDGKAASPVAATNAKAPSIPAQRPGPQAKAAPSPSPGAASAAIRRNDSIIIVHPATEAGYAAMANGNLGAARDHYQQALRSDQRSRDAILGLAVTALREGRGDEAVRRYEQLLALDPRDPDANAGLALLRGAMDPVAYESRLKSLMEERGENAALHHALGSLLARQHRWGEAQESFFRAVTLAPRSADYLFNLAVALDHLGQYVQARNYYRQALELPSPGSATFSREAAMNRLAALEAPAQ